MFKLILDKGVNIMSLLDEDLVDQKTFEEHFGEMLYDLYERMMSGTLSIDEIDKNPFTEREIGGLIWKFNYSKEDACRGYVILSEISSAVYDVLRLEIEDEEKMPILNKEWVKDAIIKLIDLYWDKSICVTFYFEVRSKDGDEWICPGGNIHLYNALLWRLGDVKQQLYHIDYNLDGKIALEEYKELFDWIRSIDDLPF